MAQELDDLSGATRFHDLLGLHALRLIQAGEPFLEGLTLDDFLEIFVSVGNRVAVHRCERLLNLRHQAFEVSVEVARVTLGLRVNQRGSQSDSADNKLAAVVGNHGFQHSAQLLGVASKFHRLGLDRIQAIHVAAVSVFLDILDIDGAVALALGHVNRLFVLDLAAVSQGFRGFAGSKGGFADLEVFFHLLEPAFPRLAALGFLGGFGLFLGRRLFCRSFLGGRFFGVRGFRLFGRRVVQRDSRCHVARFALRCVVLRFSAESLGVFVLFVFGQHICGSCGPMKKALAVEGLGSPARPDVKKPPVTAVCRI